MRGKRLSAVYFHFASGEDPKSENAHPGGNAFPFITSFTLIATELCLRLVVFISPHKCGHKVHEFFPGVLKSRQKLLAFERDFATARRDEG